MSILDLGCGWGSGALFFAEMLPKSKVTAFSNSRTQKEYIDAKAKEKGLTNLNIITGDVAVYEFEKERESFDRVVSIEVSLAGELAMLTRILIICRCLST
jgi:cation-transporting P-type ATPase 13A2